MAVDSSINYHIEYWIEKIDENFIEFSKIKDPTPQQQIEFAQHQYHLVMVIHRTLSGRLIFTGSRVLGEGT
jgi:hypothetical protein